MWYLIVFGIGIISGILIILIINRINRKDSKEIAMELISQTESQKVQDLEILLNRIKDSFGSLSLDALSKNTTEFLKLAKETFSKQTELGGKELESKKGLIDQTLEAIKGDLKNIQALVNTLEKDREQKFGELTNQLKVTAEQTGKLQETTNNLRAALANTKVRGAWGERMAQDVLNLAGFAEGINYLKNKALEESSTRPDFTFFLPQNLKVNMDAKFPLNNYLKYLESSAEIEKEAYKKAFLQDTRKRIKEVTTKNYINPSENTVDCVIVFIPNEQVYAFIHENDRTILDEALKSKVIPCSPVTLYAILAIIRQAVDNFNLEKTASQMLSLFGTFHKHWTSFLESMQTVGDRIDKAKEEYNKLVTTRRNQLERPLRQIEDLRNQKGISAEQLLDVEIITAKQPEDVNKPE